MVKKRVLEETRRGCDFFMRTRSENLGAVAYGNPTRQRGRVGFVLADASGFQNSGM